MICQNLRSTEGKGYSEITLMYKPAQRKQAETEAEDCCGKQLSSDCEKQSITLRRRNTAEKHNSNNNNKAPQELRSATETVNNNNLVLKAPLHLLCFRGYCQPWLKNADNMSAWLK